MELRAKFCRASSVASLFTEDDTSPKFHVILDVRRRVWQLGAEPVRLHKTDGDVMGELEVEASSDLGRQSIGAGVRTSGLWIDPIETVGLA